MTVYDVMVDHDSVLIVMELVKASPLHDMVQREGPLRPERIATIGLRMLDVLTAAHEIGIIHRDVKPANVLVGQNDSVKLADFGIARFEGDPTLTEVGAIMGTPTYMAPEQIRGHESSPATDLWGLGVTLFYAIEGLPAFGGPSPTAALAASLVPIRVREGGALASGVRGSPPGKTQRPSGKPSEGRRPRRPGSWTLGKLIPTLKPRSAPWSGCCRSFLI